LRGGGLRREDETPAAAVKSERVEGKRDKPRGRDAAVGCELCVHTEGRGLRLEDEMPPPAANS
jgi:hypothetical protein